MKLSISKPESLLDGVIQFDRSGNEGSVEVFPLAVRVEQSAAERAAKAPPHSVM